MPNFQLIALVVSIVALAIAYRHDLLALVNKLIGKTGINVKPSIAVTLVNELISVTELRDKLAAESCQEGVEACTNLLRVIVEQSQPTKTAG